MAAALNSIQSTQASGADVMDRPADDSSTEQFLMYGYKVVQCSKRYRHDWSVCPFAHTGEMAARRDPSRYLPIFCFHSKQRLPCPRGEECPYSHNLFEYWLHPQRYRTEMCQFGASCTRPVCFFAHGAHQLRHTGMPGGPQPVVAPPEPNSALAAAGFPGTVTDPAVKQQQQLMALQAAAAGFSSHQMRSDSLLPVMDPLGQGAHAGANAGGYGGLMDGGGSMDMPVLHSQVGNSFTAPLPASAPLSAPLPQLSPDLLAALSNMSNGPPAPGGLNPLGGGLMHQGSGIPASYTSQLPPPRPLGRSITIGATHPGLQGNEHAPDINELAKQLAVMQLMQNGSNNASAPLPQLSGRAVSDLLVQFTHMQNQQEQHAAAQQVNCTAGLGLESFLATPSSGAMMHSDNSFSCPLPPAYGSNPSLTSLLSQAAAPAASANLPRVPSASAAGSIALQQQLQLGGLCINSSASPAPSDNGRDAPSPHGARDTAAAGTTRDSRVAAPSKKAQPWSAPVSPCTSSKGGNDLQHAAHDIKLTSISFTAGGSRNGDSSSSSPSSTSNSVNHVASIPSEPVLNTDIRIGSSLQPGEGDAAPLLMIGDTPMNHAGQVMSELGKQQEPPTPPPPQQQQGMGQEMAVKLLAQLPEDSVRKLLAMVAHQQ